MCEGVHFPLSSESCASSVVVAHIQPQICYCHTSARCSVLLPHEPPILADVTDISKAVRGTDRVWLVVSSSSKKYLCCWALCPRGHFQQGLLSMKHRSPTTWWSIVRCPPKHKVKPICTLSGGRKKWQNSLVMWSRSHPSSWLCYNTFGLFVKK